MALYAIGDLHLSLASDKPMDIFGPGWTNHAEKLKTAFEQVGENDTTVICGDLTWGMTMEEALEDFRFIGALPGRKIILKGNHDYWWSTATKAYRFFEANGIGGISILNNNCYFYGDTAICGTRGWFYEEERHGEHDKKVMARELMRLETSLKAAGDAEKLCFLHYPPVYGSYLCVQILELFEKYSVKECIYGHIHGRGRRSAFEDERNGVKYRLVSADHVDFSPVKIME